MKKFKYSPCFNVYKHYYDSGEKICIASFPCSHLAHQYVEFYDDFYTSDDPDVLFSIKKESVAKFTNF